MFNTQQIKEIIPHRFPSLLVDRVSEIEEEKRAAGIKNVTANEKFFNGRFPDYPVMPGVLIVEALAQVSAVIMFIKEDNRGKIGLFAGIDNCRFKKQVRPGDQLRLEMEMMRARGSIAKAHAIATIDDEIVCEADVTFALFDHKKPKDLLSF